MSTTRKQKYAQLTQQLHDSLSLINSLKTQALNLHQYALAAQDQEVEALLEEAVRRLQV
ncbi:hypothetical protein [Leeuwenhoekiella sp. ZYFB001]|uniref:hypothetical protein n=1 Tax=Leeuwenhoekiella sp. ZYFB001 TaxID=2719912 RepID=UPI00142F78DA|nr:hypothetical protein [Leeuwenhoekiella sp. ZYFB001]